MKSSVNGVVCNVKRLAPKLAVESPFRVEGLLASICLSNGDRPTRQRGCVMEQ